MSLRTTVLILLMTVVYSSSEDAVVGAPSNIMLGDKNWDRMLEGEWMVKFYAPWCPACRAMEETWNDFAKWGAQSDIKVGSVDVTSEPALNGRFMITALPTIYHVINGEFRQYTSARDLEDFKEFISTGKWKDVATVSSWTSPTSFMMSSISRLFSFSMDLKSYHNSLNNDYGFPTWLSMLLFGLLIITIGLFLGMGLVLASDYIWGPPKYYDDSIFDKKHDDELKKTDPEVTTEESEVVCNSKENENDESNLRQRKAQSNDDKEEES